MMGTPDARRDLSIDRPVADKGIPSSSECFECRETRKGITHISKTPI